MTAAADLDLEIPLKKPIALHLMMILLTAGIGLAALLVPRKPGRGANLAPGIHLDDETVAIVIPMLSVALILLGLFFLWSLIMLLRRPRFSIRTTQKWFEVPGPAWAPDLQRLDWSRVLDISQLPNGTVRVTLDRGRRIAWPPRWFASPTAAREAAASLKECMAQAHQRIGKKRP